MLKVFKRAGLAAAMLVAATSSQADVCYMGIGCSPCQNMSRAYVKVGVMCGVCQSFCYPHFAANLPTEAQKVQVSETRVDAAERTLFVTVPPSMIKAIAMRNPEAAGLLIVMNVRSLSTPNLMPSTGSASGTKMVDFNWVNRSAAGDFQPDTSLQDVDPSGKEIAALTWKLNEQSDARADLQLTHRIVKADGGDVVRSTYPDISVNMRHVKKAGGNGYWMAVGWEVR